MSIALSPEMLAATYELLRTVAPFRGWKLPPARKLTFKVTKKTTEFGYCEYEGGEPITIACSDSHHGQINALILTMAHEMIHVHLREPNHGSAFIKCADRVCRMHGFDRKTF